MASFLPVRLRFLHHLLHRHFFPPIAAASDFSTLSYSETKSKLGAEFDHDKLVSAYDSLLGDKNLHSSTSRFTQRIVLRRLAKARRFSDIETLIEKQKQSPNIQDERFLSSLIHGYGMVGMLDQATRTFNQMEELGTPRSSISFNELLCAYNLSKKFDQVPKLFSEIPKKFGSVSPDKMSYGILMKSLCESGSPESGYLILDEMEKNNIEITPVVYTTLIDAFYKKKKIEDAEKIWKEMVDKGCSPDVTAYNVRVMNAALHGKPEDVAKLLDEMNAKKASLKPDTFTYNFVITSYCKNGMHEDAKKVYEGLKANGCTPNYATFKHFIFFLCRSMDYDYAFKVGMDSIKEDKIPDFPTMRFLVFGLAKKSRLAEVKDLLRGMKEKNPARSNSWIWLEKKLGLDLENKGSGEEDSTD